MGAMILAASSRLDQLWSKCTPSNVLGWLAKTPVRAACCRLLLRCVLGLGLQALRTHAVAQACGAGAERGGHTRCRAVVPTHGANSCTAGAERDGQDRAAAHSGVPRARGNG